VAVRGRYESERFRIDQLSSREAETGKASETIFPGFDNESAAIGSDGQFRLIITANFVGRGTLKARLRSVVFHAARWVSPTAISSLPSVVNADDIGSDKS